MSRLLTRGIIQQTINISGGDTWTLDFDDSDLQTDGDGTTDTLTIPENVTLHMTLTFQQVGLITVSWIKNGNTINAYTTFDGGSYTVNRALSFNENDTIAIFASDAPTAPDPICTITIREDDENGRVVSELNVELTSPDAPI
jgi:hypothetical protein